MTEEIKRVSIRYEVLSKNDSKLRKHENIPSDKSQKLFIENNLKELRWNRSDLFIAQKFQITDADFVIMPSFESTHSIYILSGKYDINGTYIEDRIIHNTINGQINNPIIICPSGQSTSLNIEGHINVECLHVDINILNRILQLTTQLDPGRIQVQSSFLVDDELLASEILKLIHELDNMTEFSTIYIESLITLIGAHLLKDYCKVSQPVELKHKPLSSIALQEVTDYIENKIDKKLSLDELASQVNLSTYYFSRSFKASTGMTPHNYIMNRRIYRAQRMLLFTHMQLSEIALSCGFSSQTHMTSVFKKALNTTPKRYRLENFSLI